MPDPFVSVQGERVPVVTASVRRMHCFTERIGGFVYGGDYNPEQWPPEVWREDVVLMREAHVTLVSVGIFAWGSIEPREGEFHFDWLDEVMDLLHANGIAVNLATPTAAPPAWFAKRFPDALPISDNGNRMSFGERAHYDPSSPDYRAHAARITRVIAERYGAHPALAMWHIGNEYGTTAYNEAASLRFRVWLQERYGSLDRLNDAWTTRFWGQHYSDWSQIDVPGPPHGWSNPARRLDFKRFTSDVLLECFMAERDIIRSLTPDIPIVTNFMRFYGNADYWRWAEEEDVVALDIYPNPAEPGSHVAAAFNFDLMRSLRRGQPWLLMEQATSAVSQWRHNQVKEHGRMRLGSYQAVAHGADAVMFFQWRASVGGSERFHSAMLPHSGTASRTWHEVTELGGELSALGEINGARASARIAIVFDWGNWWALGLGGLPSNDFVLPDIVMRHYAPLWRANVPVDVVNPHSDLSGYAFVVVPNAYLIDERGTLNLSAFAREGGHLLISYFSGVVTENNVVWPNGYPGAFRELIGAHIHEYWPTDGEVTVQWTDGSEDSASHWSEDIHPETAAPIGSFVGGALDGRPAVLVNEHGEGRVTYLATRLADPALARLMTDAAASAGIEFEFAGAPDGVEVVRRSGEAGSWLFVLNHGDAGVRWSCGVHGDELLTGVRVDGVIALTVGGVAVIRES